MRKVFIMTLMMVLIFSVGCVSAADLTEYNFDGFTAEIPETANFKQSDSVYVPEGSSGLKYSLSDPKYSHPVWDDDSYPMRLEFVDFTEDQFDDYKDVMKNANDYSGSKAMGDDGDLHIFNLEKSDAYPLRYAACKLSEDGDKMVIVCANNLDDVKEMANSVVFD